MLKKSVYNVVRANLTSSDVGEVLSLFQSCCRLHFQCCVEGQKVSLYLAVLFTPTT